jgi:hypothetical protein
MKHFLNSSKEQHRNTGCKSTGRVNVEVLKAKALGLLTSSSSAFNL